MGLSRGMLTSVQNLRGKEATFIALGSPKMLREATAPEQVAAAVAELLPPHPQELQEAEGCREQNTPEINISGRKFCTISYACHIQMFSAETDGLGFY